MGETEQLIKEGNDAKTILQNIKFLREFKADEKEFWKYYSKSIINLCKSPFLLVVESSQEVSNWTQVEKIDTEQISAHFAQIEKALSVTFGKVEQNGYSFEPLDFKVANCTKPFLLSFKIDMLEEKVIIASIIVDRANLQQFNDIVVRTQLIGDVYASYQNNKKQTQQQLPVDTNNSLGDEVYGVLELLNLIKDEKKFVLASMKLVDELCLKFDCSRVSLGWKKDEYIHTVAVSHLEKFDKKSDVIKQLQNIYEECADQEKTLIYPLVEEKNTVLLCHEEYGKKNSIDSLVSLPIIYDDVVCGVVTLEKKEGLFNKQEITLLTLTLMQLNIWLYDLYEQDKWLGKKLFDGTKKTLANFVGSDNTFIKFASIILSLLLLYSIFFEWEYKIEVSATLDTDNIAYIQAPYDSFVKNVYYYPGEFVSEGETVIELDKEELLLKKLEMESDVIRYTREAEKARAKKELADMNIAIAKVNQATAALKKVEYYLQHSKIKAPFDGFVVEGNKKELLSSPVTKGDMLLKIANAKDIFIKFKISEKYIDEIAISDKGELKLLSRPDTYYPIEVNSIIPVAQVDGNGGNIFVLKANSLQKVQSWWRPGMSGIAKIHVGKRKVIWIVTHSTMDFLRMYFWL